MRNVIASWKRHGEHELTDDGRKNFQRHEKPRDDCLTLTYPQASLRRTGLCWEATQAPESAVDRFPEPHCAGLHPAQWLPSGSHSCFRSLKASQHIRQNLLMAPGGAGGWPPASLRRAPQNLCPFFKVSQQAKLCVPSDQYTLMPEGPESCQLQPASDHHLLARDNLPSAIHSSSRS